MVKYESKGTRVLDWNQEKSAALVSKTTTSTSFVVYNICCIYKFFKYKELSMLIIVNMLNRTLFIVIIILYDKGDLKNKIFILYFLFIDNIILIILCNFNCIIDILSKIRIKIEK